MKQLWSTVAALCGMLCVLGLVSSVVNTYSSRALFDPTFFSNRVAASLEQPAVARVVAGQLADQIIAAHRDLTAYRPIMLGTLEYVVSSSPFRAVVRRAAKTAHATLISTAGEELTLNIADFGILARNALSAHPEIAAKVPSSAHIAVDMMKDWTIRERLLRMLHTGHRMRVRAYMSLAIAIFAGATGFVLARRKDRYLLRLGVWLVIITFVVAAIAHFGGGVIAGLTPNPIGADLVRGLWPVFIGPLALRMLILGSLGLVLVAAVTSLLEKVSLTALARETVMSIASRRPRARWALLRGTLLAGAGLLVLFHPEGTVILLTVIGGAVVLFAGIQEVFTTIVLLVRRFEPAWVAPQDKKTAWPSVAVVGVLVLALTGAGAYWLGHADKNTAAAGTLVSACNGYPGLCDRRLNEIAFPATHNSMAGADNPGWMFPNQEQGVLTQLEDGVRGFLIDIHYGVPVGGHVKTQLDDEEAARAKYEAVLGKEGVEAALRIRDRLVGEKEGERDIYSCHGFCELGEVLFTDVLSEMRTFLVTNPGEVMIIIIQDEGVTPADVAACFAASGLDKFTYHGPVKPPWPTLRELIDRDERVLVFAENEAGRLPWYHQAFDIFQETPYRFTKPSEFSNEEGRGGTKGSLLLLNHWIETTPAPLPSNAEIVNSYDVLYARAVACRRQRGMMPNLVAVDFYQTGDLFKVVRALNGVLEPGP